MGRRRRQSSGWLDDDNLVLRCETDTDQDGVASSGTSSVCRYTVDLDRSVSLPRKRTFVGINNGHTIGCGCVVNVPRLAIVLTWKRYALSSCFL